MADVRITCVTRSSHPWDAHQGITHVGGIGWHWTRQQVVASIQAGTNSFYVLVNGRRAEVGVVNGQYGPYLRTHHDGYWDDNLLALPACVWAA